MSQTKWIRNSKWITDEVENPNFSTASRQFSLDFLIDGGFRSGLTENVQLYIGHIRPQWPNDKVPLRDRRVRASKPDFAEDTPCIWANCLINLISCAKRPPAGVVPTTDSSMGLTDEDK
ncbi:hypothetical protein AVEN_199192-1 [Araneus ventricosus]|uniref:Uncharacterized protein n=1 Tax=Araneus ventricosus TaxID=182803 RepID=A0A4Y2MPP3_ARAVE|nr:hypothetical protein AVEN_30845-1 [Araneus ventricosus]GBN28519.1 hypothetical protein AVEN_199192-1 [Araneus ventricosus]